MRNIIYISVVSVGLALSGCASVSYGEGDLAEANVALVEEFRSQIGVDSGDGIIIRDARETEAGVEVTMETPISDGLLAVAGTEPVAEGFQAGFADGFCNSPFAGLFIKPYLEAGGSLDVRATTKEGTQFTYFRINRC